MSSNLELEVSEIGCQIEKKKDLKEVHKLLSLMIDKLKNAGEEEVTEKVREYAVGNIVSGIGKCRDFYKEWVEGKTNPTDEYLDDVERLVKWILDDVLSKFSEKDFPSILGEDYFSSAKESLKTIEEKIREEKAYRMYLYNDDKDRPSDGAKNNSSLLDEQIRNFQSQINVLKQEIKQNPKSLTIQQKEQKIEDLKLKIKEKENKRSQLPKKSNFPTGLVVGGGIVIAVLLLVIIFLVKKNSK